MLLNLDLKLASDLDMNGTLLELRDFRPMSV
jgi:hypothetical protein